MELTKKQKEFADEYIDTGNATKSAEKTYNTSTENSAASIGSQNLRKIKIEEYLQDKAEMAVSEIFRLSQEAKNENVRLGAGKDVLDRAGFKPIERKDITSAGEPVQGFNFQRNETNDKTNSKTTDSLGLPTG